MTGLSANVWENIAGLAGFASVTAVSLWLVFRKRPTAQELERARRQSSSSPAASSTACCSNL